MKKIVLIFFLTLMCFMSIDTKASPSDEIQNFYQKKSETLAKAIIQDISDKMEEKKGLNAGVIGFIAGLFIDNLGYVAQFKSMKLSPKMMVVIQNAEKIVNYTKGDIDLYADPNKIRVPGELDCLWGIFFATGNPKIPEAIRLFIEQEDKKAQVPDAKGNTVTNATAMAAEWSLAAIAKEHSIVKESADKLKEKKLKIYNNHIK